jgi:hypothetical protein
VIVMDTEIVQLPNAGWRRLSEHYPNPGGHSGWFTFGSFAYTKLIRSGARPHAPLVASPKFAQITPSFHDHDLSGLFFPFRGYQMIFKAN